MISKIKDNGFFELITEKEITVEKTKKFIKLLENNELVEVMTFIEILLTFSEKDSGITLSLERRKNLEYIYCYFIEYQKNNISNYLNIIASNISFLEDERFVMGIETFVKSLNPELHSLFISGISKALMDNNKTNEYNYLIINLNENYNYVHESKKF